MTSNVLIPNLRHTSETDDWQTPPLILDPTRELFDGRIGLDPCSSAKANARVQAVRYFDLCDNGFMQPWGTVERPEDVFINPPGGRCDREGIRVVPVVDDAGKPVRDAKGKPVRLRVDGLPPVGTTQSASKAWWHKLTTEFAAGHVRRAIFLGFSIEIMQTAQAKPVSTIRPGHGPICIPSRRIPFVDGATGLPVTGNTHCSVVVFLSRLAPERSMPLFTEHFSAVGDCLMGRRAA